MIFIDGSVVVPIRRERLLGIDILKIYAIVMVVLTHCYQAQYVQARFAELWIYNAVPFFFIIGAFFYGRKYCELFVKHRSFSKVCRAWYGKQNFHSYFTRICIPYFVFMIAQVIVLPLVGYASFDIALLNTIKGGMGPGGYYLVVYAQLFLLVPILNRAYEQNAPLTGVVCFCVQIVWDVLLQYVLSTFDNLSILSDVNKYLCFRFLIYFYLGTLLYRELDNIRAEHIVITLGMAILLRLLGDAFASVGGAVNSLYSSLQGALWCFGLVSAVIYLFRGVTVKSKILSHLSGSTLHILLFQQLYFCCVGVGRHKAYIDAPIALIGGVIVYFVFCYANKVVGRIKPLRKR